MSYKGRDQVDVLYLSSVDSDIDLLRRNVLMRGLNFMYSSNLMDFKTDLDNNLPRAIVLSGKFPASQGDKPDFWLGEAVNEVLARPHLRESQLVVYSVDQRSKEFAFNRGLDFYDKGTGVTHKQVSLNLSKMLGGGKWAAKHVLIYFIR